LIFPLPETVLFDLPDSSQDLQTMKQSASNDREHRLTPPAIEQNTLDRNTLMFNRQSDTSGFANDLNDLSSSVLVPDVTTPKTILRAEQGQVATGGGGKTVKIHSQAEIIQLNRNIPSYNALSNPCYFAGFNDPLDQYDIEPQADNRVVISIRSGHNSSSASSTSNNIASTEDSGNEATKF
jgi:hypothetical protein